LMTLSRERIELSAVNAGRPPGAALGTLEEPCPGPSAAGLFTGVGGAGLLHHFFERQAEARPDAVAVACAGQQMTYGQLEHRSNQLAHWLRSRDVGRGDCVGLLLPRSPEVYVAVLGILKAGAAYVPLDPEYPEER